MSACRLPSPSSLDLLTILTKQSPYYGVISAPKIKLCTQHSSFSFKKYVYHLEINIRIQNRFFAFNIISFLDHSHISMKKHQPTLKFSIHQSTFGFSNKALVSTFILSGLTIKILQWRAITLWNWGLRFYETPKKTRRYARHSFCIQHWSFDLNFTLHWTRSRSRSCVHKDNRGVLGAGFRAEEFSEIVGYSNMADYTLSYEYANCRW